MGKASRKARGTRRINVADAAVVVAGVQEFVAAITARTGVVAPGDQHAAGVAAHMLRAWESSPVALRLDPEFLAALADSDLDTTINADWLDRSPFDAFAVNLPTPLSLFDGHEVCHYWGFLATGMRSRAVGPASAESASGQRMTRAHTTYVPLAQADGIRCLWVFSTDDEPGFRVQTVSAVTRGSLGSEHTIAALVGLQRANVEASGGTWGQELEVLSAVSLLLPMYLASSAPDLDWLAPASLARPQQLATASVANVGWRVGAALRSWRDDHATGSPSASSTARPPGPGGWRLPPHIRRAHWTRVRIAARDEHGNVTGDRLGEFGTDWHYELRWIPPTPVNARLGEVPPVVRPVQSFDEPAEETR